MTVQDSLKYNEPEDWFFPVRESLGAALLMNGDAAGAEKVFREDLDRHPRNPRSLFGLEQALKAQKRDYDAGFVQKQFQASWKGGPARLKVEIWCSENHVGAAPHCPAERSSAVCSKYDSSMAPGGRPAPHTILVGGLRIRSAANLSTSLLSTKSTRSFPPPGARADFPGG